MIIGNVSKKKHFTGYKLALKIGDKLYSPFTGMEYKPGKVKVMKRKVSKTSSRLFPSPFGMFALNWKYEGLTAVFNNMFDIERVVRSWKEAELIRPDSKDKIVVVQMKIGGTMYLGQQGSPFIHCHLGSEILEVTELMEVDKSNEFYLFEQLKSK